MSEKSNLLNNNQSNSQNNNFLRNAQRSNQYLNNVPNPHNENYGAVPQANLEPFQNKPGEPGVNICLMICIFIIFGGIAAMIILKK